MILLHMRDLLFSSKVTSAARALGVQVRVVRDGARLLDTPGEKLIVDLNGEGHLETAVAWKQRYGKPVIGFVAHVAGDTIEAARRLGIDRIYTNGGFSGRIDAVLLGDA